MSPLKKDLINQQFTKIQILDKILGGGVLNKFRNLRLRSMEQKWNIRLIRNLDFMFGQEGLVSDLTSRSSKEYNWNTKLKIGEK